MRISSIVYCLRTWRTASHLAWSPSDSKVRSRAARTSVGQTKQTIFNMVLIASAHVLGSQYIFMLSILYRLYAV